MKKVFNFLKSIFKNTSNSTKLNDTGVKVEKKLRVFPIVSRHLSFNDMRRGIYLSYGHWDSELIKDPALIGRIYEHLRTATVIRLYITKACIEWSAKTKKHGWVCGSCKRDSYMFFEFGIVNSGHRFDIYGEDRSNPTIKSFYNWWRDLVRPYEQEFDSDYNL